LLRASCSRPGSGVAAPRCRGAQPQLARVDWCFPAPHRFASPRTRHTACIPVVSAETTIASRTNPAGGRRKLPQAPGNPRKTTGEKPCSWGKSPLSPGQPGTAMTGLSRRRSRVRVPSLPSLEVPANRALRCLLRRQQSNPGSKRAALHERRTSTRMPKTPAKLPLCVCGSYNDSVGSQSVARPQATNDLRSVLDGPTLINAHRAPFRKLTCRRARRARPLATGREDRL
jgi:hypothetical protein